MILNKHKTFLLTITIGGKTTATLNQSEVSDKRIKSDVLIGRSCGTILKGYSKKEKKTTKYI